MPYLGQKFETPESVAVENRWPAFDASELQRAVRMEVWYSSFQDPGPDFDEYRLIDANGSVIATKRIECY